MKFPIIISAIQYERMMMFLIRRLHNKLQHLQTKNTYKYHGVTEFTESKKSLINLAVNVLVLL